MKELETIDRRSLVAMLAGATVTIAACDSNSPTGSTSPTDSTRPPDAMGDISNNHRHVARVGGPQLSAAEPLMLSIRGNATHDHVVPLTADEMVRIRGGGRVTKTSSSEDSHQHTVTFN